MRASLVATASVLGVCLAAPVPGHGAERPVNATTLIIKRSASGTEKLKFSTNDPGFAFPAIGSSDDPATGIPGGAVIELFADNDAAGGTLLVPPGAGKPGWTVKDTAIDQYKFTNSVAPTVFSPVKVMLVKQGKLLKVSAKRTGLALAGPQGGVGIRITMGRARTCARFAGTSVITDVADNFKGTNALASALADCSDTALRGGTAYPLIADAGLCTITGTPNLSVTPGDGMGGDLHKVTLSDPDALCNDGTPAVLYVRASPSGSADAAKWIVWLEGGGNCVSSLTCARRWCGLDPPFSAAKMSSTWAPATIEDSGIFAGSVGNHFVEFNGAFVYYCSSDDWIGRNVVDVDPEPMVPGPYRIHNKGHHIVTAVIEALKAGVTSDDATMTMPDLDAATTVLLGGDSAGGAAARMHADYMEALLRLDNPSLDLRLVVDAGVFPSDADPARGVTAEEAAVNRQLRFDVATGFRDGFLESSCLAYHATDPRPCVDSTHVLLHHVAVPFYVKMDQTDSVDAPASLYDTTALFQSALYDLMTALATLPAWTEEAVTTVPGVFSPNCGHHVNVTGGKFFSLQVDDGAAAYSNHDVLWNWFTGAAQTVLIDDPPAGVTSVCPP